MRMSSAQWNIIVTDVEQRGANGSEAEMHAVIRYLGKYLDRK
jgi:hypothetical protein